MRLPEIALAVMVGLALAAGFILDIKVRPHCHEGSVEAIFTGCDKGN